MPENHMTNQAKLSALRAEIAKEGLDGFILPRTDEYQGEFLAPYAERLAWLTGFTGSAGVAVILNDAAVVMSDGRYTIQLKAQVDGALYETGNSVATPVSEWIEAHTIAGMRIGYDAWLYTPKQIETIQKGLTKASLVPVLRNPVDALWTDQPARPLGKVSLFADKIAGKSSAEKRLKIVESLRAQDADACVIAAADNICWLLNVRGADVDYAPLVLSYVVLWADGTLDWFIEKQKVSADILKHLGNGVRLHEPQELAVFLTGMTGKSISLDRASVPSWFEVQIGASGAKMMDQKDPCTAAKAIKTAEEQDSIRDAHRRDGLAMIRFMMWLEAEAPKGKLDELSVAAKLDEFRAKDKDYRGESFATIAGMGGNGAIVHYRSLPETNNAIKGDGLLLLDSGGQYASGGTTDITRTFAIGQPTQEMRENYTRVLKGHIALARGQFPEGTTGAQVDVLARQPLWDAGLDYAHGTGHGVGCYLGVHEEAASISSRGTVALKAGMLLSNEPGYYKEDAYGIRIENLVLVEKRGVCADTGKQMLGFETITLVPYDCKLIMPEMLDAADKIWLKEYHQKIEKTLASLLSAEQKTWLAAQNIFKV